ncbi:MAG TPA: DUF362 domain-containing protein [Gemmataceae bacterium]|nr:DUF362 domain-containing protein [Gemmataceae bacterium]
MASSSGWCGVTRRGFLLGAAGGLAAGLPAAWFARDLLQPLLQHPHALPHSDTTTLAPPNSMPGPYPGRVIEVRHPQAVSPKNAINPAAVERMIDRGMAMLTGAEPGDVRGAWGRFFEKGQVVGIKVNPVGRKALPGEWGRNPNSIGAISSPAVLVKVVKCLREVGLKPQDIIVFERYANEFEDAGYLKLVERELPGVRWYASAHSYSDTQLDIAGFDRGRDVCSPEMARHITGYDPDVFTTMGFCAPEHSRRDDRRYRSHLSMIVSRLVDKVINIPVLKDHRSAGVTLALKNMSHGMNNNVARSHLGLQAHGFGPTSSHMSGPNQCNTFIPQAVSQERLRRKATLHILDGLIGVYEGGPGCWNKTWATWRHNGLFFATDPVALDHVGWDTIDAQRAREGWSPVERMGWVNHTPEAIVAGGLAPLAAHNLAGALPLAIASANRQAGRGSETFNLRQPEHIILAGVLGLGRFQRGEIDHRKTNAE